MYATVTTHYKTIVVERAGSVVYLMMDRPETRNAMNLRMVQEMLEFFTSIREDRSIRCVVMRGAGRSFSSGADIKEWRAAANKSDEEQMAYAEALDAMLMAVQYAPQVTVAAVEGAALGGGFGLICVSDIAVADEEARLALPEVRLGLAPAIISPYIISRIGLTRTRQLALTGRWLSGKEALEVGLVHDVAPAGATDIVVAGYVNDILHGSPEALAATKETLFKVAGSTVEESRHYRVETLCRLRQSDEGREGMAAFAEKRKPRWASADE